MGLFINKLKLKAAAFSMHQFCPKVRDIFPEEVDDEMVEATTAFLYFQVATEILGRRFTERMAALLIKKVRSPQESLTKRVAQLGKMVQGREKGEEFHEYITRVIKCLLSEAGCPRTESSDLRDCFIRFQDAVGPMNEHLAGIKKQNTWVIKRAA